VGERIHRVAGQRKGSRNFSTLAARSLRWGVTDKPKQRPRDQSDPVAWRAGRAGPLFLVFPDHCSDKEIPKEKRKEQEKDQDLEDD